MSLYSELDYRAAIRQLVLERKKIVRDFNYQKLAELTDIQKSYVSKVLNGSADLNSDQLYKICQAFNLDEEASNYLELLLEYARTSIKDRKSRLRQKIERIQSKHLDSGKYLEANQVKVGGEDHMFYYFDPVTQLVHMSLTIPTFQRAPDRLASALGLPAERVLHAIERLEKLKIIERSPHGFKVVIDHLHLPKNSPVYHPSRQLLRSMSLQRLDSPREDDYSFSAVISADERTKNKLQQRFLELLKESEHDVKEADPRHVLQMNFDLFYWTRKSE